MYKSTLGSKNELFFRGEHRFSSGISIGTGFSTAFYSLPESFYINLKISNHPSFLRYRLMLLSRNFPDYEMKENSINPTIALITDFLELELGLSFRILETENQTATIHPLYRLQFNILDRKHYGLILKMSNFDLFRAGNITDLYYTLGNQVKINDRIHIDIDVGFHNAGQIALSSYYSTFFGQIGVKYYL